MFQFPRFGAQWKQSVHINTYSGLLPGKSILKVRPAMFWDVTPCGLANVCLTLQRKLMENLPTLIIQAASSSRQPT